MPKLSKRIQKMIAKSFTDASKKYLEYDKLNSCGKLKFWIWLPFVLLRYLLLR